MASRFFTIGSTLLLLATLATAQLSFRNDPSQNSFQIRTPGFQQSFTRYFNGQQGNLFAAQQQSQPQYAPLPHQQQQANSAYSYHAQQQQQQQQAQQPYSRFTSQFGAATAANGEPQYTSVQDNYINPNIRLAIEQQRMLQQQQQQQQYQPQVQQQQQQQQPQQQPQQQYYSQEDINAYLQGQQAAQAQYYAQQQPQANPQSQYEYVQQQQQLQQQQQQHDATQQQQQQQQPQQDPSADAAQATHNKLIGVAFSPSNEVSQVKFNGNGLKYNF